MHPLLLVIFRVVLNENDAIRGIVIDAGPKLVMGYTRISKTGDWIGQRVLFPSTLLPS